MRPVHRGGNPTGADFDPYSKAYPHLVSRIGMYCSYCERRLGQGLAVEHIQPKGLPQYAGLIGRWENYLLGCVNCNGTKGDTDVLLDQLLLPDRDNTFHVFRYPQDGTVTVEAPSPGVEAMARTLLALVGLDKRMAAAVDENGELVAIDRVSQRMEAWMAAQEARAGLATDPGSQVIRALIVNYALAEGFFSIWMAAFQDDVDMRQRLIDAFRGTRDSDCFDAATAQSTSPRAAPQGLAHGGKV